MEITIKPISILKEFREIYGNKLLEELVELTIEENPERGFFLSFTLEQENGNKKGIMQSLYLSGADNPEDLKKFFLSLDKNQHFYFSDRIFKEDDHFDENHDLLIYYPDCNEDDATEFLIRDFGNNPADETVRNKMREYIQKEEYEDRLVFMSEEIGIEVYLKEKENFLEGLSSILIGS